MFALPPLYPWLRKHSRIQKQKECKSQGMEKNTRKHCLLDLHGCGTRGLTTHTRSNLWTWRGCCSHGLTTCTRSHRSKCPFEWERGSWGIFPSWGATWNWQLMEEEKPFLLGLWPLVVPTLQWMAPQLTCTRTINGVGVVYFKKRTCSWEGACYKEEGVGGGRIIEILVYMYESLK